MRKTLVDGKGEDPSGLIPSAAGRKKALLAGSFKKSLLALSVLALVMSCASPEVKDERELSPQTPLIWPSPPEPARVSFLKTIERPEDIGAGKGFFKRVAEFILGPKSEEIIKPYGITTDSKGRVIVADTSLKRVHIYDLKEKKYSVIEEAGKDEFQSPIGAAVDAEDNIYITDSVANKIYAFNSNGRFLYGIDGGIRLTGVAINKDEKKIFAVDTGSHNIRVYDLKGNLLNTIGKWGAEDGEFRYPVDIFIDRNGDMYVADTMNYRIQIFDKDGKFLNAFGSHGDGSGDFGRPKGVAVDRDGNIYVTDALFDTVQIFDKEGKFLLNFGSLGRKPGFFWLPTGLFIDNGDKIYVADSYNKRIQIFEYLGHS